MSYVALFVFPLGVIPAVGIGLALLTLAQRRPHVGAGRRRARDLLSEKGPADELPSAASVFPVRDSGDWNRPGNADCSSASAIAPRAAPAALSRHRRSEEHTSEDREPRATYAHDR